MQNDEKKVVDLYIPRTCSVTNKLIGPKDHASVQISVADIDEETGVAKATSQTVCINGFVRKNAFSDAAMTRLMRDRGVLTFANKAAH
jgi:small subunit ribosomal protein S21e